MLLACNYSHIMLGISPIEMLILSTFNKTGKSTCSELQTYQRVLTLQNCSQLIAHFSIWNANSCWVQNICFYYKVRLPVFFIHGVDPLQTPRSFCSIPPIHSWPLALGFLWPVLHMEAQFQISPGAHPPKESPITVCSRPRRNPPTLLKRSLKTAVESVMLFRFWNFVTLSHHT